MTPQEKEQVARARFAALAMMRASGVMVMLVGLLIWHSGLVRPGGHAPIGSALFLVGVVLSLLIPPYLVRRWRDGSER